MEEQIGAITAGRAFNDGLCHIGKTIFNRVNLYRVDSRRISWEKSDAVRQNMIVLREKTAKIKALNKATDRLTIVQIKVLLAPCKRTGDKALPSKRDELLWLLVEWEARGKLLVEEEVDLVTVEAVSALKKPEHLEKFASDVDEADDYSCIV